MPLIWVHRRVNIENSPVVEEPHCCHSPGAGKLLLITNGDHVRYLHVNRVRRQQLSAGKCGDLSGNGTNVIPGGRWLTENVLCLAPLLKRYPAAQIPGAHLSSPSCTGRAGRRHTEAP